MEITLCAQELILKRSSHIDTETVAEGNWEVSWAAASKVKAFTCSWCKFVGFPRPFRLHQLLGCSSKASEANRKNMSRQSPQQSSKYLSLNKPQPFAVGSGVQLLASPRKYCNFCRFSADIKYLRLHKLLGCRAAVLVAGKFIRTNRNVKDLSHSGKKLIKCELCSFSCKFSSAFKRHAATHNEKKAYSCTVCGYTCNLSSNLKRHALVHTGVKPCSCKICGYTCSSLSNLKRHTLMHTGEKPFTCETCKFKCNDSGTLKRHKLTHTGEKPFTCKTCGYKCTQLANLKRHYIQHM